MLAGSLQKVSLCPLLGSPFHGVCSLLPLPWGVLFVPP